MEESRAAGGPARIERGWPRAAALFMLAMVFSVAHPTILVGVAYVTMVAGLPVRQWSAYTLAALIVMLVLMGEREGLWWTERGWALLVAGWFVALTLRWPDSRFLPRALGAVAGAAAVTLALATGGDGLWEVLDWHVTERVRAGFATALETVRLFQQGGTLSPTLVASVYRIAEAQAKVFPAMAGLASLAALGVAWWLYGRMAHGDDQGLQPFRLFRFDDQLVWLFIGGLALWVVGGGEGFRRAGSNAAVFMGALYAVRGAAVVSFFGGGRSWFGILLLALGLLLAAPVLLTGALVIGLGDTWLDLRTRARRMAA